jgi:hypothetical protein
MSVTNNQLTLYSAFILPVLISGSAIVLTGCDDSATQRDGSVDALTTYNVAYDTLEEAKRVLGGSYSRLSSARTYAQFDSESALLNGEQLDAVMTIQRQLGSFITVIENEPGARAAAAADAVLQQNQGFLAGLPRAQERWLTARQRMPLPIGTTRETKATQETPKSSVGVSKPSNPEAKQKYDLAVQYLVRNQPNWGVKEAVDIVISYPNSHEAVLSAVLLMDKCDHIDFQDFYTLTGYRLPLDRELPRSQQIEILMAAFQQRGVIPKQSVAPADGGSTEHTAESASEQHARQQQAPPATANKPDGISSLNADAEKGVSSRQFQLGLCYENGSGVEQDYGKAADWYRKAAEKGEVSAQNNLGVLLHYGHGVQQDDVEAYAMFCVAAEGGCTNAVDSRDSLAESLTPEQIAEARRRVSSFKSKPGN